MGVRDPGFAGLMLEFLAWLDRRERTYAETMDAWRTSCPRLSVWEDALADGLIRIEHRTPFGDSRVVVTEHGRTTAGLVARVG